MTLEDLKSKAPKPKSAVSGRFAGAGAAVAVIVLASMGYGHAKRAKEADATSQAQHTATVASQTATAPELPSMNKPQATPVTSAGWADAQAPQPGSAPGSQPTDGTNVVGTVKGIASNGFQAVTHPFQGTNTTAGAPYYPAATSTYEPAASPYVQAQPPAADPQAELRAKLLERKLTREQQAMDAPTGISTQHAAAPQPTAQPDQSTSEIARLIASLQHGEVPRPGLPPTQAAEKDHFGDTQKGGVLPAVRVPAAGKFILQRGDIIPVTLAHKINSDLPGDIVAEVYMNVMDSPTGKYILIPAGSKLIGEYNSNVGYGQNRTQLAWTTINFCDGSTIDLGRMPGHDPDGSAGLAGKVNNHVKRLIGGVALSSVLSAGLALSQNRSSSSSVLTYPSAGQQAASSVAQQAIQSGMQLTSRNLNIPPTLTNQAGSLGAVFVERTMVFSGPFEASCK